MAKNRMINTHFWDDSYIIDLDPIQKLVFIYALTNPLTSICGIYEIALKRIAFDTGIDKDMILKIFARFEIDGKMVYRNGWVAIKNFIKHQAVNSNIDKGIEEAMKEVPVELRDWVMKPVESLSKPSEAFQSIPNPSNYPNPNPNLNIKETKIDIYSADESAHCPPEDFQNQSRKEKIPYSEIIEYLNGKCNTHFRPDTPETKRLIQARIKQGFTTDDFKKVIDIKYSEWFLDPKMIAYLRPQTLFGNKFESYLNQQPRAMPVNKQNEQEILAGMTYAERVEYYTRQHEEKQKAGLV